MIDPLAAALPSSTLPTQAPPDPKMRDAAQQFEAYMVSFLAQQMRGSLPKDGPLSSGAMDTFSGLWDEQIGTIAAQQGSFGLARQLEARLASHGLDPELTRGLPLPAPTAAALPQAGSEGVRVTSGFGVRSDPFTGEPRMHEGLDLATAWGTPIKAVAGGVVSYAGERGGYGNVVIVKLPDGTENRYGHCSSVAVKEGDVVTPGTVVGAVGSTGRSTGPHLHFEVREGGVAVDPAPWLRRNGGSPL